MPRAYFVLLKIVKIQPGVKFKIVQDKVGYRFESNVPSLAKHIGKYVEEISHGAQVIKLAEWSWKATKNYAVRLTKNIINSQIENIM